MNAQVDPKEPLGKLRALLAHPTQDFLEMIEAGPAVRAKFQPIFSADHLQKLTKEEFQSFLLFRNNQHWSGLHRKAELICSDMYRLRAALSVLLDESRPVYERLNDLQPGGRSAVPGLGRAVLTAILLIMHPSQYGVWNGTSQFAMQELGMWPKFHRGETFGRRYVQVNDVLQRTAQELGIDLWTLDGLWSQMPDDYTETEDEGEQVVPAALDAPRFGLERHLHDFLVDNWEKTALGQEWDLLEEDGEITGYEYPTPVGKIDLLARSKKDKTSLLVVELKRDQTSDATVGQALRYMGYVREHLAQGGDVQGLIVCHRSDDRLQYALQMVPHLDLMEYEVDFRLKKLAAR